MHIRISAKFTKNEIILIFQFEQLNTITQKVFITNTYTTRSGVPFVLHNIEDDLKATEMVEFWSDDEDFSTLIPAGLTSGWTKNKAYKDLIIETQCWDMSMEEIIDEFEVKIYGEAAPNSGQREYRSNYSLWIKDVHPSIKGKIVQLFNRHVSIPSISSISI